MAAASNEPQDFHHDLSLSAFTAEYKRQYQDAVSLNKSAIEKLTQSLDQAGLMEHDKKRVLRRKIKIHEGRLNMLSAQNPPPFLLVVPESKRDWIEEQLGRGVASIGLEDIILAKHKRDKEQNPKATIEPFFNYLINTGKLPFYTPMIDISQPNLVFHIEADAENSPVKLAHWCSTKIKLDNGKGDTGETIYICDALKHRKRQIPRVTLSRVSEYPEPCIATDVGPASYPWHGRPVRHMTSHGSVVQEDADRDQMRSSWALRRFTFAGRRFVWKPDPTGGGNSGRPAESLYEVRSEWPKPGSKTGKIEDDVFDQKLAWTNGYRFMKPTRLEVLGGLDPLFRELVFASQCTRYLIEKFGHA